MGDSAKGNMGFHSRTSLKARVLAEETATPLTAIASTSEGMTDAQLRDAMQKLEADPEDLALRATLLGHYLKLRNRTQSDIEARREQVLWMIQHRPAERLTGSPFCLIQPRFDPDGYSAGKQLWKKQADMPGASADVFGNAATFVMLQDAEAAEELLKRAEAAEPTDPRWPLDLAELYQLATRTQPGAKPRDKTDQSRKALIEYEKSLALAQDPEEHFYFLTRIPKTAFDAGDIVRAAEYATKLLAEAQHFEDD